MALPLPVTQVQLPPGFIDLGLGDPAFSLLPLELLHQATEECFARGDPSFLQYGAEQGNGNFRAELAAFLSRGYHFPVEPDSLFITHGVSGGLDLLCTLFTTPGDVIFVEDPTYFLALRIFKDHGLQMIPIATDRDGLVIEALEEKLKEVKPKFVYIIPTFQNPTGQTLSAERRERLAALASNHNFLLIADEVYHFLSYGHQPPRPFACHAGGGHVISLGSFSKILAPGLRLGWIQSNTGVIQRLVTCGLLDSGGGLNPFASAVVCEALAGGGVDKNIEKLHAVYQSRILRMESALRRHLPEAQYRIPDGGYFFWVHLPEMDTLLLQEKAKAYQVGIRPGVRFSAAGGFQEFMRLSYVHYESGEIEDGLVHLRACLDAQ